MKPITDHPFTQDLLTSNDYFWNCKTPAEMTKFNHPETANGQFEALLSIVQNNKKLFSLICTTIPTMDGWTTLPKACALASLTLAIKPITAVEIGIWAGRSMLPVAMALKTIGSGIITGIDPYSPQESAKSEVGANADWWGSADHQAIKQKFLSFVRYFQCEQFVRHIEKPSDEVEWTKAIQLLHIDGSHTDQAVRDAERFGKHVTLGGIVVMDDINWVMGGVLRAIDTLEEMGFVEVVRRTGNGEDWNIMQRVK
jgi:predicted O-methyltransferase YrrM